MSNTSAAENTQHHRDRDLAKGIESCLRTIAMAKPGVELVVFRNVAREAIGYGCDIDRLYDAAVANGTVAKYGDDAVQAAFAEAMAKPPQVMPPPTTQNNHEPENQKPNGRVIPLLAFNEIVLGTERRYLVKGLIPRVGLCVVWGPPKCGKSFWVFDLAMHVALGWAYRERRVQQGPVTYCAFEGGYGFSARIEAFRQKFLTDHKQPVPFYLEPITLSLVRDHSALINTIKGKLDDANPAIVVLDTLNRSIEGSESSDEDMTNFIRAADAIREAFNCVVVIVHHCGVDGTRPRGHTSLTGAVDAQLAVKRDNAGTIEVKVEWLKDGQEGDRIASRLQPVDVGTDEDGETITSCIVVPTEIKKAEASAPRLNKNQQTMFSILHEAGERGLTLDKWNDLTREAGIGTKRKADLFDIRKTLLAKRLIRKTTDGWAVNHQSP